MCALQTAMKSNFPQTDEVVCFVCISFSSFSLIKIKKNQNKKIIKFRSWGDRSAGREFAL